MVNTVNITSALYFAMLIVLACWRPTVTFTELLARLLTPVKRGSAVIRQLYSAHVSQPVQCVCFHYVCVCLCVCPLWLLSIEAERWMEPCEAPVITQPISSLLLLSASLENKTQKNRGRGVHNVATKTWRDARMTRWERGREWKSKITRVHTSLNKRWKKKIPSGCS